MQALQDLIGKCIVYSVFTPNRLTDSTTFNGVLKEIDMHMIAIERDGITYVINTMSATFEEIYEDE
ncbi:hypothetical protein COB55_00675 [Candidatus Wolfebacteria bacterium]|nr:MAG: hypothetical protein COB55_00675 [Candidatus Wolfebacteria bacterium]